VAKGAKYSREEIVELVTHNVAETITPRPTELVLESFQKFFKEKLDELLDVKEALLLTIGPCVTTDGDGIFSNDIRTILDYVEEKMQTQFNFDYGVLMYVSNDEFYSIFLPH